MTWTVLSGPLNANANSNPKILLPVDVFKAAWWVISSVGLGQWSGSTLGLWKYQILLLVHGQINGQNPFAQPRVTCPKLTFFWFLKENICCGYSLETSQWGTSNGYPQHMFSLGNKKKNIYLIIWILFLASSQDKLIEISYLFSGKWDKLDVGHGISTAQVNTIYPDLAVCPSA